MIAEGQLASVKTCPRRGMAIVVQLQRAGLHDVRGELYFYYHSLQLEWYLLQLEWW